MRFLQCGSGSRCGRAGWGTDGQSVAERQGKKPRSVVIMDEQGVYSTGEKRYVTPVRKIHRGGMVAEEAEGTSKDR